MHDLTATADSPALTILPDHNNLHSVRAQTCCAFLDIVLPPYSDDRPCTYYCEVPCSNQVHTRVDDEAMTFDVSVPEHKECLQHENTIQQRGMDLACRDLGHADGASPISSMDEDNSVPSMDEVGGDSGARNSPTLLCDHLHLQHTIVDFAVGRYEGSVATVDLPC